MDMCNVSLFCGKSSLLNIFYNVPQGCEIWIFVTVFCISWKLHSIIQYKCIYSMKVSEGKMGRGAEEMRSTLVRINFTGFLSDWAAHQRYRKFLNL